VFFLIFSFPETLTNIGVKKALQRAHIAPAQRLAAFGLINVAMITPINPKNKVLRIINGKKNNHL
jgi:hypothetical protein